jgi:pimeloyl-ACP methyl ester carboxylesterase
MKTKKAPRINILKKIVALAICSLLTTTLFSQQNQDKNQNPATKIGYAPVNGLKMYYEIYGEGMPIVLIHGAFMTIHTNFGALIPELAKNRRVIAVELQGHGHTGDIDRSFSQETMADDVAALLQYLKIDSADIFGYSLGGDVALQLAIRHPQVVRKMIVVSAAYKSEGWTPETRAILPTITPALFEGAPMKIEYDSVAPDPKHWPQFVEKLKQLTVKPFDFGSEKIKAIKAPTLLIAADGDGVLPEHVLEMYRLLGGNYMVDFGPVHKTQLAILPGSSHISVMMQTNWLLSMISAFLNAQM